MSSVYISPFLIFISFLIFFINLPVYSDDLIIFAKIQSPSLVFTDNHSYTISSISVVPLNPPLL